MGRNKKNSSNKYKKNGMKNEKSHKHQCRTTDYNIWNKHFSSFQTKMQTYNLYLKDIKGDGNCMFRAVADQFEGDEGNYKKYRELAVDELKEDEEFFSNFIPDSMTFEKYLSLISKDGVWGGNIELQSLSKALGVNFVIHMSDRPPMIMSNEHFDPQYDEKGNLKYLHLAYHYGENIGEHYSSVRNMNDKEGPAKTINFDLLEKLIGDNNNITNENFDDENYIPEETKVDEIDQLNEKIDNLNISEEKTSPIMKQKKKKDYPKNKKCFCGSKKAYKNCCLKKEEKEEEKNEEEVEKKDNGKKTTKHLLILV